VSRPLRWLHPDRTDVGRTASDDTTYVNSVYADMRTRVASAACEKAGLARTPLIPAQPVERHPCSRTSATCALPRMVLTWQLPCYACLMLPGHVLPATADTVVEYCLMPIAGTPHLGDIAQLAPGGRDGLGCAQAWCGNTGSVPASGLTEVRYCRSRCQGRRDQSGEARSAV